MSFTVLRRTGVCLAGIRVVIFSVFIVAVTTITAHAGWDRPPDAIPSRPNADAVLPATPFICTYHFGFNIAKEPFSRPLVRKAFSAAIDRTALAGALEVGDLPAMTFTPPGVFGHVNGFSEGVGIAYNPTQAQQWLSNAGYPNGQGLPEVELVIPFSATDDRYFLIGEVAQARWSDHLNVDVTLVVMEISAFLLLLQQDPPQIWLYRWCTDQPEQVEASEFLSVGVEARRIALGNWHNSNYDSLLAQAANTTDPDVRKSLYKQAEEILVETDDVILPLIYSGTLSLFDFQLHLPLIQTAN